MKAFIEQRADPYILQKDGWYYFTASVPAFDKVILRKARTLAELPAAEEKAVWSRHPSGEMSCNIWAPEIQFVDGNWVIYFAAAREDADESGCSDHRTYALINENQDPTEGEFTEAGRIKGAFLFRSRALDCRVCDIILRNGSGWLSLQLVF